MEMELPLGIPISFFLVGADFEVAIFSEVRFAEVLTTISTVNRGEGQHTIGADFVGSHCGSYIYFLHCFLIVLCDDTLGLFHDDLVAVDDVHALLETIEALAREVIDDHVAVLSTKDGLNARCRALIVKVERFGCGCA